MPPFLLSSSPWLITSVSSFRQQRTQRNHKDSVESEARVQCVGKDYLPSVNGGEKSGALYVSVTRDGLILLCLYILTLHFLQCSTNYNYLHSNPTLPWPILNLSHSTFFLARLWTCERACTLVFQFAMIEPDSCYECVNVSGCHVINPITQRGVPVLNTSH